MKRFLVVFVLLVMPFAAFSDTNPKEWKCPDSIKTVKQLTGLKGNVEHIKSCPNGKALMVEAAHLAVKTGRYYLGHTLCVGQDKDGNAPAEFMADCAKAGLFLGRLTQAQAFLSRFLEIKKQSRKAFMDAAGIAAGSFRFRTAQWVMQSYLATHPKDRDATWQLCRYGLMAGAFDKAARTAEIWLKQAPAKGLGKDAERLLGMFSEYRAYKQLITLANGLPKDVRSEFAIVRPVIIAAIKLKKKDMAKKVVEIFLKGHKDQDDARMLGLMADLKLPDLALLVAGRLGKDLPVRLYLLKARALLDKGRHKQAQKDLFSYIQQSKDKPAAVIDVLAELQNHDFNKDAIAMGLRVYPKIVHTDAVVLRLGAIYFNAGKKQAEWKLYADHARMFGHSGFMRRVASRYLDRSNLAYAEKAYKNALKLAVAPTDKARVLLGLASLSVHKALRFRKEAIPYMRAYLELGHYTAKALDKLLLEVKKFKAPKSLIIRLMKARSGVKPRDKKNDLGLLGLLLEMGDAKAALHVMHGLVMDAQKNPKLAIRLLNMVRKAHGTGMLELLREMSKHGSDYPPLVQGLIGMRFLGVGNLYKARPFLKVFFDSKPTKGPGMNAEWRLKLGVSLENAGVLDLAATAFQSVLDYSKDKGLRRKAVKGMLEICVFNGNDCQKREKAYQDAWGKGLKAMLTLGDIYRENAMLKKAMDRYGQAYEIAKNEKKSSVLSIMLGIAGQMGKIDSMDDRVDETIKACKDTACIRPIVEAFAKEGMYRRAIEILADTKLLSPENMPDLCGFYLHAGKADAAYQCYASEISGLQNGKKSGNKVINQFVGYAYELMSAARPELGTRLLQALADKGAKSGFVSGIMNNMECRLGRFNVVARTAMHDIRKAKSMKDTRMAVETASCLLENGRDKLAEAMLSATMAKYPDNAKAAYFLAGILYDRGEVKKARDMLLHLEGKGARWAFNAMQAAYAHGDGKWAVNIGRKAVQSIFEKGHGFSKNDMGLVQTLIDHGEANFVIDGLNNAIKVNESDPGFMYGAGRIYASLAMPGVAVTAFEAAIKSGGPKEIYRDLAKSLLVQGKRDKAVDALIKYIDAAGGRSDSRHARFAAVINSDITDASPGEVGRLLKAVGANEEITAGAYLVMTSAFLRADMVDKGYDELRVALRASNALNPQLPSLNKWLKRVLYQEITADRGDRLLKFLDSLPWSVALGTMKTELLCVTGDYKAAAQEGDRLAKVQESIGLFGRLSTASLMLQSGYAKGALRLAWQAIRSKGVNMRVFVNAIPIIIKADRLLDKDVDADDILSVMQKRSANQAAVYFNLASAFSKAGMYEDAAKFLEKRMQYPFMEGRRLEVSRRVSTGMKMWGQAWMAGDDKLAKKAVEIMQEPGADTLRILEGIQNLYEKRMLYSKARKIAKQRLSILPGQGLLRLKIFTYDALDNDPDAAKADMKELDAQRPSDRFAAAALLNVINAGNLPMAMNLIGLAHKAGYNGQGILLVRFKAMVAMGMTAQAREFLLSPGNGRIKSRVVPMVAQDPRYSMAGLVSEDLTDLLSPVLQCRLAVGSCRPMDIKKCTSTLDRMGVDGLTQVKGLILRSMQSGCFPAIKRLFKLLKKPGISKYDGFTASIGLTDVPVDLVERLPVDVRKKIGDFLYKQAKSMLVQRPEESWYHSLLAVTKGFSGDWGAGMAYFDKASGWFKTNAMIMNNEAYFMSLLSIRPDDSIKLAEKARILDPSQDSYYAETLAWAMYMAGKKKEALRAEQQATRYMTGSSGEGISEGYYHLGMINLDLDHRSQAMRAFRISQYLYPSSVYARRSFKMLQNMLKDK